MTASRPSPATLAGRDTNARRLLMARREITDRWAVRHGERIALCGPTADERADPELARIRAGLNQKVIYATQAAAMLAAYELILLSDNKMWPHRCPRSERHWHLTSQATPLGLDMSQLGCDTGRYRKGERWVPISYTSRDLPDIASSDRGRPVRQRRLPAWQRRCRRAYRRCWRWLRRWGMAAMLRRKISHGTSGLVRWLGARRPGSGERSTDQAKGGWLVSGRHRKPIPAWEACGFPPGTTGYHVDGPITKRIRAQSPELQESRLGGDHDGPPNDRISNP